MPVDRVIADGAYYSIARGEALSQAGITPVIPPPAHAVVHGEKDPGWHDTLVSYIREKGIYAFHKKYGYGLRSRVEAQISRIKRCVGVSILHHAVARELANLPQGFESTRALVCRNSQFADQKLKRDLRQSFNIG